MKPFYKEGDDGFTTVGMAIALLLAVVLAFGALQARWTQARSGQVQYVADAAVLAADSVVAELVFYSQVVDAVSLSLGVISLTAYAASAVAAFIPGGSAAAGSFADAGAKVLQARRDFSKSAVKGLNTAQKLLPALCTARALDVLRANGNASGVAYQGVAVPFPFQGESLDKIDDSALSDALDEMGGKEDEAQTEAKKQAEAQQKLDAAKERAWRADCGNDVCMYERAGHLAGLSGNENPLYKNAETWKFSVGVSRARNYYQARLIQEKNLDLSSMSAENAGESVARKAFYGYALDVLGDAMIEIDSQGNEKPRLKSFAHGKQEFKGTQLYSQKIYPVSTGEGMNVLHAWSGCSAYETSAGLGSLCDVEEGRLAKCPDCKFSLTTLWKVSGLTHVVASGYEYHYQRFVEAADEYVDAVEELEESSAKLREVADSMADDWRDALKELAGQRIHLEPTGHYGCIVVVVAGGDAASMGGSFMSGSAAMGTRVAISGAALAVDASVDQADAVQRVGGSLVPSESLAGGAVKTLFGAWGSALQTYSSGVTGFQNALSTAFGSIPLVGTDASSWVSDAFQEAVSTCGLEPSEVVAYKPALVSTSVILEADGGDAASALLGAQSGARAWSEASAGDLSAAFGALGVPDLEDVQLDDEGSVVLAVLSLAKGGLGTVQTNLKLRCSQGVLSVFSEALVSVKGALR